MKPLFPALLGLLCCTGCAKFNYQYAIVCDYRIVQNQGWLVVTNDAGSILKIYDLPPNSTHLVEQFDYEAKETPETYNLHLVTRSLAPYTTCFVDSHYRIKNGTPVVFDPGRFEQNLITAISNQQLLISGIEGLDSLSIPGALGFYKSYDPDTQTAQIDLNVFNSTDLLIRIRASPGTPFRSLYFPAADLHTDSTFHISWADFPLDDRATMLESPDKGPADLLEVVALTPDFKRQIKLAQSDSSHHQPVVSLHRVALPAGMPETFFRVYLQRGDYTVEKVFAPGEALHVTLPEVSIQSAIFSPDYHTLQIAVGGQPDMIQIYSHTNPTYLNLPYPYFDGWAIAGPPEAFEQMRLPDLSGILPELDSLRPTPIDWEVRAIRYDGLDYEQIQAGFPFKGGDGRFFPVARSGLQMVSKHY